MGLNLLGVQQLLKYLGDKKKEAEVVITCSGGFFIGSSSLMVMVLI